MKFRASDGDQMLLGLNIQYKETYLHKGKLESCELCLSVSKQKHWKDQMFPKNQGDQSKILFPLIICSVKNLFCYSRNRWFNIAFWYLRETLLQGIAVWNCEFAYVPHTVSIFIQKKILQSQNMTRQFSSLWLIGETVNREASIGTNGLTCYIWGCR